MTDQLQQAMDMASALPPDDQNAIAAIVIEELKSEQRWNDLFARPADKLDELAEQALRDHRAGKTQPLDPEAI